MRKFPWAVRHHFLALSMLMLLLGVFEETTAQDQGSKVTASGTVTATLNGLRITVDKKTGSLLSLEYPGPGQILKAKPGQSGLLDVAYPIAEFAPLRLASEYADHADIRITDSALIIHWDNLGSSRPYFHISGKVSATVWMKEMDDGRSISMKCRIRNHSDSLVRQVLFPDLHGLLPVDGIVHTYFRTAGFVRRPFVDFGPTLYPEMYSTDNKTGNFGITRAVDTRNTYAFYGGKSIGNGDNMIERWLDYGGLSGGISVFPKLWNDSPSSIVRVFRTEKDPNLRLMYVYNATIEPGKSWESPVYVVTPHRYGWAKGIGSYKKFVKDRLHRLYPLPDHVRDGLGFRTVVMGTRIAADGDRDAAFKFTDLPELARVSKANGLSEMSVWSWRLPFRLPGPPPYSNLGTPQQLSDAIKACSKIGVNVSLFISVVSLANPTAAAYGLKVGARGWTYHPDFIPMFNPRYAHGDAAVEVKMTNPRWQKDVVADVENIYKTYTHSIGWDQGRLGAAAVFRQFLPVAKKADPEATFSGEELILNYYDYLWNWQLGSYYHNGRMEYRDVRAFNAAFPAPRLNYNINRNAQDIKYAFMDNSYVNVMPSGDNGVNGTGKIKDYPALGRVLKQCAGLRNQFLAYFTRGELIGECLLKSPVPGAHVNAYVLPDRVLLIIMNTANKDRRITFDINLSPWLASKSGHYELRRYDGFGTAYGDHDDVDPEWRGTTQQLRHMDMAIYEFIAR